MEGVWREELRRVERLVGRQLDLVICNLHEVVGIFSGLDGHHPDPHIALTIVQCWRCSLNMKSVPVRGLMNTGPKPVTITM